MYFWLLLVSSESTVMSANPDQSHFNLHIQRGTRRNGAWRSYPKRCLQEFYVELVQLQSLKSTSRFTFTYIIFGRDKWQPENKSVFAGKRASCYSQ